MTNIKIKRMVVKIGTNVMVNSNGALDLGIIKRLIWQIVEIRSKGKDVIIITSGAIGAGMKELGINSRPKNVTMRQVCAAVGQSILMSNYKLLFSRYGIKVAQILLTYQDFLNKKTFSNLKNSLNKLLQIGIVPIINENDPISIDEIGPSFGDNDMLSALITTNIGADTLIILTDVDGLFDRNPNSKNAVLIKEVRKIDKKIESIGGRANQLGTGGMKTKIQAAKMATKSGVNVIIANGRKDKVLTKILKNEDVGTFFYPV